MKPNHYHYWQSSGIQSENKDHAHARRVGRRSTSQCSKVCSSEANMKSTRKKNFNAQHCITLQPREFHSRLVSFTFIMAYHGNIWPSMCASHFQVAHASVVLPRESWKILSPVDRTPA